MILLVTALAATQPMSAVHAQPANVNQRAVTLGHEGLAAYNKGNWAEARAKFGEAEALSHSPVFLLYMARSARNAGDLKAALLDYQKVVAEVVGASTPAPWSNAIASAKQELPEVEKKLAAETAAQPATTATAAVPSTSATASPPVMPTTSATAGPVNTGVSTASSPTGAPSTLPTSAPSGGVSPWVPGIIGLTVGALAAGVGVGAFVDAKGKADAVLKNCDPNSNNCSPNDAEKAQNAKDMANVATGALVFAAAFAAAGVVLLIVRPGSNNNAAKTTVYVAPGWAGLRVGGSF